MEKIRRTLACLMLLSVLVIGAFVFAGTAYADDPPLNIGPGVIIDGPPPQPGDDCFPDSSGYLSCESPKEHCHVTNETDTILTADCTGPDGNYTINQPR